MTNDLPVSLVHVRLCFSGRCPGRSAGGRCETACGSARAVGVSARRRSTRAAGFCAACVAGAGGAGWCCGEGGLADATAALHWSRDARFLGHNTGDGDQAGDSYLSFWNRILDHQRGLSPIGARDAQCSGLRAIILPQLPPRMSNIASLKDQILREKSCPACPQIIHFPSDV